MSTLLLLRSTPLTAAEVAALPTGALPVRGQGEVVARARLPDLPEEDVWMVVFALGQAVPGARLYVGERVEPAAAPEDAEVPELELELDDDSLEGVPTAIEHAPPAPPAADGAAPEPEPEPAPEPEAEVETAADEAEEAAAAGPLETEEEPLLAAAREVLADEDRPETEEEPPPPPAPPVPAPLPSGPPPAPPAPLAPLAPPEATHDADTLVPADAWALWDGGRFSEAEAAFEDQGLDSVGRARVRGMLQSTDPAQVAAGCRIARHTGWRSAAQTLRRLLVHADTRVRHDAVEALGDLAGPAMVPPVRMLLRDASPEVRAAAVTALMRLESV